MLGDESNWGSMGRSMLRPDDARVRAECPRRDPDERALPRAILAEQRMHLAGGHVEGDVVEGEEGAEGLGDSSEGQHG